MLPAVQEKLKEIFASGKPLSEIKNQQKESILLYGSTASGKTYWYITIPHYYKSIGVKPENFLMWVIFPDRSGGILNLLDLVPPEYLDRIRIYPISGDFRDVIEVTNKAWDELTKFGSNPQNHAWLVFEMVDELWTLAQDTAIRISYGIGLGQFIASKRKELIEKAESKGKEEPSAYSALSGAYGGEWVTIKNLHNTEWIDKVKSIPILGVNLLLTAGEKKAESTDKPFHLIGVKPDGEKSNIYRVDTIIYLERDDATNKFFMQPLKITGLSTLYAKHDITNQIPYAIHKENVKKCREIDKQKRATAMQLKATKTQPEAPSTNESSPAEVEVIDL